MAISTGLTVGSNVNNSFFSIRSEIQMSNKFPGKLPEWNSQIINDHELARDLIQTIGRGCNRRVIDNKGNCMSEHSSDNHG